MDNRPIGVFDSGVGGLSAVRVLLNDYPNESIVFFGDTARVPYGDRTKEDITNLSLQDVRFLRSRDVKAILIACNTITANSGDELRAANPGVSIIGTVDAASAAAAKATRNGRIGIIATFATVRSGAYEAKLRELLPGVEVHAISCPKLVPLIESRHIRPGDPLIEEAAAEYLAPLKAAGVDVVILGCTHYPLIREIVQNYMGPDVVLVDSGGESAKAVIAALKESGLDAPADAAPSAAYFCSARLDDFESIAQIFLEKDIHGAAEQINILDY